MPQKRRASKQVPIPKPSPPKPSMEDILNQLPNLHPTDQPLEPSTVPGYHPAPATTSFDDLIDYLCEQPSSPPRDASLATSFDNLIDNLQDMPISDSSSIASQTCNRRSERCEATSLEDMLVQPGSVQSETTSQYFDAMVQHYSNLYDSCYELGYGSDEFTLDGEKRGEDSEHEMSSDEGQET